MRLHGHEASGPAASPGARQNASAPGRPAGGGPRAALLRLQRSHGNQYVQGLLEAAPAPPVIQPKLRLGPAGDAYEREADELAGEMAASEPPSAPLPVTRVGHAAGGAVDPAIGLLLQRSRGRGTPLAPGVRANYEQALGADLSAVRLHAGRDADDLNARLRSSAATVGHDIFIRSGEYAPASEGGRELLGHELVHVVQQGAAGAVIQRAPGDRKRKAEEEEEDSSDYEEDDSSAYEEDEPSAYDEGEDEPPEYDDDDPSMHDVDDPPMYGVRDSFVHHVGDLSVHDGDDPPMPDVGEPVVSNNNRDDPSTYDADDPKGKRKAREEAPAPAPVLGTERKEPTGTGVGAGGKRAAKLATGGIDLEQMKKSLSVRTLTAGEQPDPLSVGVVVWNINHLTAGKAAKGGEAAGQAGSATSTTAEPDGDARRAAAGERQEQIKTRAASVAAALAELRRQLEAVAATLNTMVDKAIEALPSPSRKADEEAGEGEDGAGQQGRSGARGELSRLKKDVAELTRIGADFSAAIQDALTAMAGAARGDGPATAEGRAAHLEQIRALGRVWNRLARLSKFVREQDAQRKQADDPQKAAQRAQKRGARQQVRDALGETARGGIRGAIAGVRDLVPASEIEAAVSTLKRAAIASLTTDEWFQNPAVDLVLINEMNLGIDALTTAGEVAAGRLGVSSGPMMLAKGKVAAGSSGEAGQLVGKQYEYYPAVHRAGERGLVPRSTFYVTSQGKFIEQGADGANGAIAWDKANETFRGIVVHRYQRGNREFWAGILHTTPAGSNLNRVKIWPQISKALDELNQLARHFQVPLLVGGDFYIPAEGIVNKPNPQQLEEILDANWEFMIDVKLAGLARNTFLAASLEMPTEAELDLFIASVKEALKPPEKKKRPSKKSRAEAKAEAVAKAPEAQPAASSSAKPAAARKRPPAVPRMPDNVSGAEMGKRWDKYKEAIEDLKGRVWADRSKMPRSGRPQKEKSLRLLAPGKDYNADWSSTLAAGKIGDLDINRNYRRPTADEARGTPLAGKDYAAKDEPLLTMQRALGAFRYRVVEGANPTNPKKQGRGENKTQIADLFLVNDYWETVSSAIPVPGTGALRPVDDSGQSVGTTYTKISDHSPVGMLASTRANDIEVYKALAVERGAALDAFQANMARLVPVMEEFLEPETMSILPSIDARFTEIIKLLAAAPPGPGQGFLDQLGRLVAAVGAEAGQVYGPLLTRRQREALTGLAAWRPFFAVNVARS